MFKRLWVQIPEQDTGWTFFTMISCKIVMFVCLKRPKINEKEDGDGPFKKTLARCISELLSQNKK